MGSGSRSRGVNPHQRNTNRFSPYGSSPRPHPRRRHADEGPHSSSTRSRNHLSSRGPLYQPGSAGDNAEEVTSQARDHSSPAVSNNKPSRMDTTFKRDATPRKSRGRKSKQLNPNLNLIAPPTSAGTGVASGSLQRKPSDSTPESNCQPSCEKQSAQKQTNQSPFVTMVAVAIPACELKGATTTVDDPSDHNTDKMELDPSHPEEPVVAENQDCRSETTQSAVTGMIPSSPVPEPSSWNEVDIFKQPETNTITGSQLVAEVRTIYAGLVMVEKKCCQVDKQQSELNSELTATQWQAIISLHRTLLNEHHDFFLASQHPSASASLKDVPEKHNMLVRMWEHGIMGLLEVFRLRLPDSNELMMDFFYLAFSTLTLFLESVPRFRQFWIECLGKLAEYQITVNTSDIRGQRHWANVGRDWYFRGAANCPGNGRHHRGLAALFHPRLSPSSGSKSPLGLLQQFYHYTKALSTLDSCPSVHEELSVVLKHFKHCTTAHRSDVATALMTVHYTLYRKGPRHDFNNRMNDFFEALKSFLGRTAWPNEMGPLLMSCNFASVLGYGDTKSLFAREFERLGKHCSLSCAIEHAVVLWQQFDNRISLDDTHAAETTAAGMADTCPPTLLNAAKLSFQTLSFLLRRDRYDVSAWSEVHVSLVFIWALALCPFGMHWVEKMIPWRELVHFLNHLADHPPDYSEIDPSEAPWIVGEPYEHLPEDFIIGGQTWAELYYPTGFFDAAPLINEEYPLLSWRTMCLRWHRCLWLGHRIAQLDRWITYDSDENEFVPTPLANGLEFERRGGSLVELRNKKRAMVKRSGLPLDL
ncbi:Uncharacterized protein PECH_008476 [Penicillium ucsense]|uniref:DNA/RNA-binding domain-containing protein n=1 Tax=Penicillium ucsense TaxID=2839758 RepID=A0A8J8W1S8_9EURO|nr:Uncharacterized protein PECM_005934 [Penicillium ucsense]KAF7734156.1 Uncharacterized protein PECH_008476 [Penicillium ucsense]